MIVYTFRATPSDKSYDEQDKALMAAESVEKPKPGCGRM